MEVSDLTDARHRWRLIGSEAILLLAAVLWGAAFVAQKRADAAGIGVMPITAMRFLIGAAMLAPIVLARRLRGLGTARAARRHLWVGGVTAGGAMFAATALQQAGMRWTTPGVAGFITGLYVIFVPIIGRLLGLRIGWNVWIGALLAAAGLYLLSVHGRIEVNRGDALVLLCAVAWAAHVLIVGWAAPKVDAIELSVLQFAVTGSLGAIVTMASLEIPFSAFALAPIDVLYLGVVAVGIAFTLQVVGQRRTPAPHAAIILSLEAVFAAIAGARFMGERFDAQALTGAALMLAGIVAAQVMLWPRRHRMSDGDPAVRRQRPD